MKTPEDYKKELAKLEKKHKEEIKLLNRQFIEATKRFGIGAVITDHQKTIRVEKIEANKSFFSDYPKVVYYGIRLKKDGHEYQDKTHQVVFESNIIYPEE